MCEETMTFTKASLIVVAFFGFCALAHAQTAQEIIAATDKVRNPGRPFRSSSLLTEYVGGKPRDQNSLTVYSKLDPGTGQYRNIIRIAEPPRDEGKILLLDGHTLWFYDPSSKASVRISPQQRLVGRASIADVLTVNLAIDYTSTLLGTETIQDAARQNRTCWHVDLKAANDQAGYNHLEYWVEERTYYPIKAKYYSDSGRLTKILYFSKFGDRLDGTRPLEAVIIDAVDGSLVTTIEYGEARFQDVPEEWYQREYLPRVRADLVADAEGVFARNSAPDTPAAPASSEDKDLDLIPSSVQQAPANSSQNTPEHPKTADIRRRIYVEQAFTQSAQREGLAVPFPPPAPTEWQERLFLDVRKEWDVGERLSFTYSGRLNFRAEDDFSFPSNENASHDFREGYVSWQPFGKTYFDFGRINLKSGVAAGLNPTDFFKTRAVVEPLSADPAVLREDRLGALMLRLQEIWTGGAVTVAYAPGLYKPSAIYSGTNLPSLNPMFDRTNAHNRVLVKATEKLFADFSPELLFYQEGGSTRFGANVTESLGKSVVAYGEWSGGTRSSLIDQALQYGRAAGTLPAKAPSALPENSNQRFQNELAVGAAYTTTSRVTFNLEYHYSESGLSGADLENWFRIGQANAASAPTTGELWFIRAFAGDQQESFARQYVFVRADAVDAFVRNLELTAFVNVGLYDGSSIAQATADYYLSKHWTIGALASGTVGGKRSDFGSLPQSASVLFKVVRYI